MASAKKIKVRVAIAALVVEGESYVEGAVLELGEAEAKVLQKQGAVEPLKAKT
jgi:hypothetical protein